MNYDEQLKYKHARARGSTQNVRKQRTTVLDTYFFKTTKRISLDSTRNICTQTELYATSQQLKGVPRILVHRSWQRTKRN